MVLGLCLVMLGFIVSCPSKNRSGWKKMLDEEYEEILGYRGAPQGVYVGLRFRDEASK